MSNNSIRSLPQNIFKHIPAQTIIDLSNNNLDCVPYVKSVGQLLTSKTSAFHLFEQCEDCPVGSAANYTITPTESSRCVRCGEGLYAIEQGQECTLCESGKSSLEGSSQCFPLELEMSGEDWMVVKTFEVLQKFDQCDGTDGGELIHVNSHYKFESNCTFSLKNEILIQFQNVMQNFNISLTNELPKCYAIPLENSSVENTSSNCRLESVHIQSDSVKCRCNIISQFGLTYFSLSSASSTPTVVWVIFAFYTMATLFLLRKSAVTYFDKKKYEYAVEIMKERNVLAQSGIEHEKIIESTAFHRISTYTTTFNLILTILILLLWKGLVYSEHNGLVLVKRILFLSHLMLQTKLFSQWTFAFSVRQHLFSIPIHFMQSIFYAMEAALLAILAIDGVMFSGRRADLLFLVMGIAFHSIVAVHNTVFALTCWWYIRKTRIVLSSTRKRRTSLTPLNSTAPALDDLNALKDASNSFYIALGVSFLILLSQLGSILRQIVRSKEIDLSMAVFWTVNLCLIVLWNALSSLSYNRDDISALLEEQLVEELLCQADEVDRINLQSGVELSDLLEDRMS